MGDALCALMSDAGWDKRQEAIRRTLGHIDPARFFRFAIVGGVASVIQLSILVGLVELGHVNKLVANAVGFVFAATANYLMNRYFTFSGTQSHIGYGMVKFAVTSLIGLAINTI